MYTYYQNVYFHGDQSIIIFIDGKDSGSIKATY